MELGVHPGLTSALRTRGCSVVEPLVQVIDLGPPRTCGGGPNTMVYYWNTALSASHTRGCLDHAGGSLYRMRPSARTHTRGVLWVGPAGDRTGSRLHGARRGAPPRLSRIQGSGRPHTRVFRTLSDECRSLQALLEQAGYPNAWWRDRPQRVVRPAPAPARGFSGLRRVDVVGYRSLPRTREGAPQYEFDSIQAGTFAPRNARGCSGDP
jgi:hypothetical protein